MTKPICSLPSIGGLLAFSIGALLVYVASHSEVRAPAMLFAMIERLGW